MSGFAKSYWVITNYRCARDGVDAQVSRIEEDCLSDPIQCQDLGDAAAEEIGKILSY